MLDPDRFFKLVLILLLVLCVPAPVLAINLSSSWTYRESGGDSSETFREIRQNYSFGINSGLAYSPSHALQGNASVGYTQTNGIDASGSRTGRTITPTAGFSLTNDIFAAKISGSTANSQSNNGDWAATSSWMTTLDSMWAEPYVPALHLSYGEDGTSSQSGAVSSFDTPAKNFSAGVDWDLLLANLSYRYRQSRPDDLVTNQSHFVKAETGGRFWDNRISINLSQLAQFSSLEVAESDSGGSVDVPVGRTVRVATSLDADPVEYSCNGILTKGVECLSDPVSPAPAAPVDYAASRHVQIAIAPLEDRSIGAVNIAFNADFDFADDSLWDLYEYRSSSDSWELIVAGLPSVNTTEEIVGEMTRRWQRIEIPETDQEFLLVSNQRTLAGQITGVDILEVFPLQLGGSGRESRRYQSTAGINMRLTENISSSLGLNYERTESETDAGGESENTTDKISTRASLNWRLSTFLSASVGANEYKEVKQGEEQQLNRTYSLSVNTIPLSTMTISYGVQLSERYGIVLESGAVDMEQKTLESLSYNVSGTAQLYPDLTAKFNLRYSEDERWRKDEDADTGRFVDSTQLGGRLDLNARLFKDFNVDIGTTYSQSESDGSARESGSVGLSVRYRVSELLLMRGSYRTDLLDPNSSDEISLRIIVQLLETDKTRLGATLGHTQAEEAEESVDLNGTWLINDDMSLIGQGGYRFGESSSYNLKLNLRIRI